MRVRSNSSPKFGLRLKFWFTIKIKIASERPEIYSRHNSTMTYPYDTMTLSHYVLLGKSMVRRNTKVMENKGREETRVILRKSEWDVDYL